ncbi:MAG: hypothetical protein A3A87_06885 [Candidatus Muproteobacteria bacterium RIFCSPLOWO2_01_FULL_60_18]|uniref:Uncharacterized protein n=1 Tax=Candidatus Muproteobacteria bacterium RIFCSPLOWO2_01_FULL_60_18 TaxID=1817768 RepID=A0A1F6TXP0_9PROT|nr:MAG: hypothetical protein A3A87_06885 [Candidatus Muproteobacteria bacterium RIFCSPLOWO2_01_FULL_60_18]
MQAGIKVGTKGGTKTGGGTTPPQGLELVTLTDTAIRNAKPRRNPTRFTTATVCFSSFIRTARSTGVCATSAATRKGVIALGAYPSITLGEARRLAQEVHDQLVKGLDPAEQKAAQRAQASVTTFESVAQDWLVRKKGKLSPTYYVKIEKPIRTNLFLRLGEKPIHKVTAGDVLDCLRVMEARGAIELARRCKSYAAAIFNYAATLEHVPVGYNPAQGLTRDVLEHRDVKHFPHLVEADLGEFLRALAEYPGRAETRLAVKLLLLTNGTYS